MIQNQYQFSSNAAAGTLTIKTSGNLTIHTIVSPVASTGTYLLKNGAFATIATFPIGTIGTLLLDASIPNGAYLVSSATDNVIVTHQTP